MEKRKTFDRDNLPSMVKANATHEPSSLKMVTFAPADNAEDSDHSSICHSPTWDDYGRKKKKKDAEGRKRLTKGPPPAAMDLRPGLYGRAISDTVLSGLGPRQSMEARRALQEPKNFAQTEVALPVSAGEAGETAASSPAFIGGVRLERERDEALQRHMNSRAPSQERSVPDVSPQYPSETSARMGDRSKKRETAPAEVSYPPTASKTYFLKQQSGPTTRPRRGSFGQDLMSAAGKLFKGSKDKDASSSQHKRNGSQESVQMLQASQQEQRGRQMDGLGKHTRGQSYDSHTPMGTPKEERRSMVPPLSWMNMRKNKTISMVAVPPDSARDGSFSPGSTASGSTGLDQLSFLDRPYSPPVDSPLSPVGSLSASIKAKMSPAMTPTAMLSPSPMEQQAAPQKKTFTQALRSGFRSSSANPDDRRTRPRSGTMDTLVDTGNDTNPSRDFHPLQSHPLGEQSAKGWGLGVQHSAHRQYAASPASQPHTVTIDASSSSSYPDTESLPPSPMTTPETSRPQSSSKDNAAQGFRIEDIRKASIQSNPNAPRISTTTTTMRQASAEQAPPRIKHKQEAAPSPRFTRPRGRSGSNFVEDLPASSPPVLQLDDLWAQGNDGFAFGKKPVDTDQLSFTSALTSIDVKRSFNDLNAAVAKSPPKRPAANADVTPLSLDADVPKQPQRPAVSSQRSQTNLDAPNGWLRAQGGGFQLPGKLKSYDTLRSPPSSFSDAPPRLRNQSPASSSSSVTTAFQLHGAPRKTSLPTPSTTSPSVMPTQAVAHHNVTASTGALPLTSASTPRSFALTNPGGGAGKGNSSIISPPAGAPGVMPSSSSKGAAGDPLLNKPIAKMLVECCHCRFYQDMPSRVYEAMARPDDVVKDKRLGVSGAVTTCVKCPWCSHNMSRVCCAGYAAVVYLREKLHGPV